jgi:hypothetical protein
MIIRDGAWYFAVVCPDCGRRHIVGEAPLPTSVGERKPYPAPVSVDCECGSRTHHPPGRVVRWQVHPTR